jgi:hypothetical protein
MPSIPMAHWLLSTSCHFPLAKQDCLHTGLLLPALRLSERLIFFKETHLHFEYSQKHATSMTMAPYKHAYVCARMAVCIALITMLAQR